MDILTALLSSRVKAEVFRLLFGPAGGELHVRELARRADLNDATVRQELKKLTRLGIIAPRRSGNRTYYRADPAHPLFPDIRGLVLKTSGWVDQLRRALQDPAIRVAFVFGSLAAHTGKPESDVDLMVIGDVGLRTLTRMLSGIPHAVGREINPHVLSPEEFAKRRRAKEHFLSTVLDAPRLFIIGGEHELETVGGSWLAAPPRVERPGGGRAARHRRA